MKLYEYQAKQIFYRHGIKVPKGAVAENVEDVTKIMHELGGKAVLKAQVLVGGRGKAGGIKKAVNVDEAVSIAREMFGKPLKGEKVKKIYIEELTDIKEEWYLSLTLDRVEKCFSLIFSTSGGIDIEEIALKSPEKIFKIKIDPRWGLWDYQIRELFNKAKISQEFWREITTIIRAIYRIFIDNDAELVEINPLAVTSKGLVALDAKITLDDNALFRHRDLESLRSYPEGLEGIAEKEGMNYVKLDGNVGVIANGAGMAMATMDLIYLEGGKPANFLDIGGGASAEMTKKALEILTKDENVRVIFMNIFGGITRCDEVARGLLKAFNELRIDIPVILRLSGTNEEEGRKIVAENLKNVELVDTMEGGARRAVEVAKWQ
ncbi:MAG: ADP-forming succinate--CoA ligase subunit beta [Archaeoglobaceae archaeon]|nr:ADP-forming succinate--CoA ligase subunit beta [Archaeoglobaceae archaeon]MDW7989943.1 ADP-forming succinate--CoA ligase subunit beta [Archaeoglobaceae archaeon]